MQSRMNSHIIREITPLSDSDCFYIADRRKKEFTYPIHRHREFELNFTENSKGVRRIVGDSIEIIGDYDLVLITSKDLEQVWEQHDCTSTEIREITIQFSPELFFNNLLNKNQFSSVNRMLKDAEKGISFPLSAIMRVYSLLDRLSSEADGFYAVVKFLTILYELSKGPYAMLSSSAFARVEPTFDDKRIAKVQEYIADHFREPISLPQLADLVNMTPVSFSRFFKLCTGKNISNYIIDVRIGAVARLLVDTSMSISEICYDCGFNNLSNFNRIFLKKKGCSPKVFRENYCKKRVLV